MVKVQDIGQRTLPHADWQLSCPWYKPRNIRNHVVQAPVFSLDSSSDQSTHNEYFSQLVSASLKKERVLLTNFRKVSNGCILINYGEPLIKHISKLKYFPNPSRNKKRFLAACSVLRRASFSTFEVFDVARGQKKGLLKLWLLRAFKKLYILTYFQKSMWFYSYTIKDSLMGKVWGKTFLRLKVNTKS